MTSIITICLGIVLVVSGGMVLEKKDNLIVAVVLGFAGFGLFVGGIIRGIIRWIWGWSFVANPWGDVAIYGGICAVLTVIVLIALLFYSVYKEDKEDDDYD